MFSGVENLATIVSEMPASYSSKIIKAGALLEDTKTLLLHWDVRLSVQSNLDRIRRENIFGKASRSRVEDILPIFRQRYLSEPEVAGALVTLVQNQFPSGSMDRLLYFHSARADKLLYDVVTEILAPMRTHGITDIHPGEIQRLLAGHLKKDRVSKSWSDYTLLRVTRGLLSTLRDFHVLEGSVKKRIAPSYLPLAAFAYIAFYLRGHLISGARLLEHPDWKLFFLSADGVERFLLEAHQSHLLEYHAAGTVTRLTFPAKSLEEYAVVLTQGTH
jgi:hypothetical protein